MFASFSALIVKGVRACLNLVFPPKKHAAQVEEIDISTLSLSPRAHEALGITITTLAPYHRDEIQILVRALKYERSIHAAHLLATLLSDYLLEQLADEEAFSGDTVLVPVPLNASRVRSRGYNQTSLILKECAKILPDTVVRDDVLVRSKNTPQQTRLSREARLANVSDAFSVPKNADLTGLNILLIDDVTTTGATLLHARRTLERNGAKVSTLAICRA